MIHFRTWLLAFLLFAAGCGEKTATFSGTLEMTEHSVGARVPGRIVTLNFDEGKPVSKGESLATLDRYEQSRKDYDRVQRLFEKGGASEQTAEQAKLAMDDQQVVAPVDGIVLTKVRELGEVVAAGGTVAVIGEMSKPWVRIYVPEGWIARVHVGQKATLKFDGLEKSYEGHVVFVAPRAEFTPRNVQSADERVTQAFAVKVAPDAPDTSLKPGIAADVTLDLTETGEAK